MPDTCHRCSDPLDAKAEEVWKYKLCEFCAVIAKARIGGFLDKLLLPEQEFETWLEEGPNELGRAGR